jgi:hypothetical protein
VRTKFSWHQVNCASIALAQFFLKRTARTRITRGRKARAARRPLGSRMMSPREKGVAALNVI